MQWQTPITSCSPVAVWNFVPTLVCQATRYGILKSSPRSAEPPSRWTFGLPCKHLWCRTLFAPAFICVKTTDNSQLLQMFLHPRNILFSNTGPEVWEQACFAGGSRQLDEESHHDAEFHTTQCPERQQNAQSLFSGSRYWEGAVDPKNHEHKIHLHLTAAMLAEMGNYLWECDCCCSLTGKRSAVFQSCHWHYLLQWLWCVSYPVHAFPDSSQLDV